MTYLYKCDLNEGSERISAKLESGRHELPLDGINIKETDTGCTITLLHSCRAVYGLGERFNCVNQKGRTVTTEVTEQFCNQGSVSYCPIPFFFTDRKLGVFVDTFTVTEFAFEDEIRITIRKDNKNRLPFLYLFSGTPKEMIGEYIKLTGMPTLVPKWSFTPWMSANRWNTEEEVLRQLELLENSRLPHGVMVIEAWSDEATFYRFNEHGEWKNPAGLVKLLKEKGIHLILWQIPVLKKLRSDEIHEIHEADQNYAVEHGLCIKNLDGTPYTIPEGHWFHGSMLPDFTNPETIVWWFGKRQYLLDMGVDGFKTDGGEFILTDAVAAANGNSGLELRNQYAAAYIEEYSRFIGKNRVLFSRAGYKGQQQYPIQWAGDQMSTWEELRHILAAGLSINLSGVPFWGFDISGFAGAMPSLNLYERATQLSVFAPIMQWHSEPVGGQFSEEYPSADGINDRSPWNIGKIYKDDDLLQRIGFHYNMRMNLLPYLYNEALKSVNTGCPLMKHLILEYPEDERVRDIEDSFMLGDLLIAPILNENQQQRRVYLPEGTWTSLWPMEVEEGNQDNLDEDGSISIDNNRLRLKGGHEYLIQCGRDRIPVFLRDGGCLALNLDQSLRLGSFVGNGISGYNQLCFYLAGNRGEYHFMDDLGNEICLSWKDGTGEIKQLAGDVKYIILNTI